MARQEANEAFANTSFLYGGNAGYIDELYAQYRQHPDSVSADWKSFFDALGDDADDVIRNARGASWKKDHWPIASNGELVSALDGHWAEDEILSEEKVGARIAEMGKTNGMAVSAQYV